MPNFKRGDLVTRYHTPYVSDEIYKGKRVFIWPGTLLKVIALKTEHGHGYSFDSVVVNVCDPESDFDGYTCEMGPDWIKLKEH